MPDILSDCYYRSALYLLIVVAVLHLGPLSFTRCTWLINELFYTRLVIIRRPIRTFYLLANRIDENNLNSGVPNVIALNSTVVIRIYEMLSCNK